ncbi:MAG: flagellar biosynthetic protein FliO [Cryobacterium sp.]
MDTVIVALRVLLSLGVVLALLWYLQRRISRVTRGTQTPNLVTVVGRQAVGAKSSVVVVDVDGQRLTLGVTDQSVTILHATNTAGVAPPAAPAAPAATDESDATGAAEFARLLGLVSVTEAAVPASAPAAVAAPAPRFAGSILSPSTWQQAATTLRQGR